MSGLLKYFETEMAKAKAAAEGVMHKSDEDARDITPEEKAEVDAHLQTYKMYSQKADAEKTKIGIREQLERETGVADQVAPVRIEGDPGMPGSLGEAFVKSGAWRAIQEGVRGKTLGRDWKTAGVELPYDLMFKAAASPVLESNATSLFGSGTAGGRWSTFLNQVVDAGFVQLPPVVSDLVPSVSVTSGNSVSYPVVKARTPAAYPGNQPIAEGVTKFNALYEFDVADERLMKLGVYTKLSTELIEDAPAIAAYINQDLPAQIRAAEDVYFMTLFNTAAATASTLGGTGKWDSLLGAITDIRAAGGTPNGIVISAGNWAEVLTEKAAVTGNYLGGMGPQAAQELRAWGVQVVISANAADDLPLVGDFARGAKAYRRGGLTVDSTNTDQNDFILNLMTIRAEERVVLGITYPEWFLQADLT